MKHSKYWFIVTNTPLKIELCAFTSNIRDGARVIKSFSLTSSLAWKAKVHNINVPGWLLSKQEKVDSYQAITVILEVLEKLHFCIGLTNNDYNSLGDVVYNTKKEIVGKTESFSSDGQPAINIKRAVGCFGVGGDGYGRVCAACRGIRNALDVALHRMKHPTTKDKNDGSSSSSNTNWRFLGELERSKRESDERRRRVNAERREMYAKRKSLEEKKLKKLSSADNGDMVAIFQELDKGCDADGNDMMFPGDPNASFFWSLQREIIESKKPKWHPR